MRHNHDTCPKCKFLDEWRRTCPLGSAFCGWSLHVCTIELAEILQDMVDAQEPLPANSDKQIHFVRYDQGGSK
jgi:hypothetical protein